MTEPQAAVDAPAPEKLHGRAVAVVGVVLAAAFGVYLRSVNLNPTSLWLDDAWVSVLARCPLPTLLEHCSPTPPLFAVLVAGAIALFPDPELAAQLVPFASSVVVIFAVGLLAWRLSGDPLCAFLASWVMACDPIAIICAARVKQYSSDALTVVVVALLFTNVLGGYSRRSVWAYVGATTVGLFLSSSSFVVSGILVPVAVVTLRRRGVRDPHLAWAACVALVAAVTDYELFLKSATESSTIQAWFADRFLPRDSLSAFLLAAGGVVTGWLKQSLHAETGVLPSWLALALGVTLTGLGVQHLLRRGQAALATALGLLVPALLLASALRKVPLGSGRVELFLVPLIALLVGLGGAAVGRAPPRARLALGLLLAGAFVIQLCPPRAVSYPDQPSAPLIDELDRQFRDGDQAWCNLHASFALGFYTRHPIRLEPEPTLGTGFRIQVVTPGFRLLNDERPDLGLGPSVKVAGERVFLLAVHDVREFQPGVHQFLAARGYRPTWVQREGRCVLIRFER